MPVGVTGRLFERARRIWKRATKSTKRKGFHSLEFQVEPPRPTAVASLRDLERGTAA
jgi:hypothetical protein